MSGAGLALGAALALSGCGLTHVVSDPERVPCLDRVPALTCPPLPPLAERQRKYEFDAWLESAYDAHSICIDAFTAAYAALERCAHTGDEE